MSEDANDAHPYRDAIRMIREGQESGLANASKAIQDAFLEIAKLFGLPRAAERVSNAVSTIERARKIAEAPNLDWQVWYASWPVTTIEGAEVKNTPVMRALGPDGLYRFRLATPAEEQEFMAADGW